MRVLWITAAVILVDQITKVIVYMSMYRNQSIALVGDWLKLTFTENPGMAFGINFGPRGMVTIFSILATILIIFYLWRVRGGYGPYLSSLALILGGALGNIIDRVFYGAIFGYAPLFQGRVVDFIHVDLWRGSLQDLLPFFADVYVALFPIWNVADMAIVVGVVGILVFQQRFHDHRVADVERIADTEREQAFTERTYDGTRRESDVVHAPIGPSVPRPSAEE